MLILGSIFYFLAAHLITNGINWWRTQPLGGDSSLNGFLSEVTVSLNKMGGISLVNYCPN